MTPDWPSLWEREPGLRPNFTPLRTFVDDPKYGRCDVTMYTPELEEAHAALCRDAAVRWFIANGGAILDADEYCGHIHRIDAKNFTDAALFVACKAVLDSRCQTSPL